MTWHIPCQRYIKLWQQFCLPLISGPPLAIFAALAKSYEKKKNPEILYICPATIMNIESSHSKQKVKASSSEKKSYNQFSGWPQPSTTIFIISFGDFCWRRHVAFPSKLLSTTGLHLMLLSLTRGRCFLLSPVVQCAWWWPWEASGSYCCERRLIKCIMLNI